MHVFRNRTRRRFVASFAAVAGLIGLPILAAQPVHAAEGDPPYFKVIVTFEGEQIATDATAVGITIDGIDITNIFAVDTDTDPSTLNLVSEPQYLDVGVSGRLVSFSEYSGSIDLSDYDTSAYCYAHYDLTEPNWDPQTLSGEFHVNPAINHDCFITNTLKPASLSLTNVADTDSAAPGDTINYTVSTTNSGISSATDVELNADLSTPLSNCTIDAVAATNPAPTLAAGETMVCTGSYTVPENVTGASVVNTASVTSSDNGELPTPVAATVDIDYPDPTPPPVLEAVNPGRLFDTRVGEAQGLISVVKKKYGGATELKVKITGVGGVPETGVAAVSLNVTAAGPVDTGFVTVYPCGTRPGVSNLNYVNNQIVANAVIVPVSNLGEVCFYSSADTNLIADLNSWVATAAGYAANTPSRLVDTRPNEAQGLVTVVKKKYGGATELRVKVTDVAGVPATNVAAVSLNVTAAFPDNTGFVTVYPCGGTRPVVSSLNYTAGQIVANAVVTPVSGDGEICVYSSADTHILIDVSGSFATGSAFHALTPLRLVDTRTGEAQGAISVVKKRYGGAVELRITIANVGGVPATGAGAVSLNVTAVNPVETGFVTVYPCGTRPGVSSLNYTAGAIVPNAVIAPLSAGGELCLYASELTNLLVDINAWFEVNPA